MSPWVMTRTRWTQRSSRDGAFRPYTTSVRSCDARAIDPYSYPSKPPIKHDAPDAHEKRDKRPPPTSHGARRADARRARDDARDSRRETRTEISFRSRTWFARGSRARDTVARRTSVGRTDRIPRRGGGAARSAHPVDVARSTDARTRRARSRARRSVGKGSRAIAGAFGRSTRRSTGDRARTRRTDRRRSISCDESRLTEERLVRLFVHRRREGVSVGTHGDDDDGQGARGGGESGHLGDASAKRRCAGSDAVV